MKLMAKKRLLKIVDSLVLPTKKTKVAQTLTDYITLFYGPPGVGKTTFVNELSDRVLFLSTDRGTRFLETMRIECFNWKELNRAIIQLEKTNTSKLYDIICLDHVDDMCNFCADHVCETMGIESLSDAGYAKGWNRYKSDIWSIYQRLLKLGVGVVSIAHEATRTVRTRSIETERTMPDMPKTAWKIIIPKCDLVGYCGFRMVTKGGKKLEVRTLETLPREDLYCKDRTERTRSARGWELLNGKQFVSTFTGGSEHHGEEKEGKEKQRTGKRGRRARR